MSKHEYLNNKKFEFLISNFQKLTKLKGKHELMVKDLQHTFDRKVKYVPDFVFPKLEQKKEECKKVSAEYKTFQNELSIAFYTLSENIVKYAKFQLIDNDDAIQEGVLICFEKIHKFDPDKGKAFNYMTTCIFNHFKQLYRTARSFNDFKKKLMDKLIEESSEPVSSKYRDVNLFV